MAIAASGAVSFSDLRTEFVGGSSAISISDLYRGGSNILSKAGDNPAVNMAASVPTSGVIDIQDFHGTAKAFKNTVSSSTTNVDADALFGDDYDVNYPKIIDINSGVTIGGNGDEAIDIPSGLASTLTINNAGIVIGFGGASAGAAGGSAINCAVSGVVINNTGQISGGGGAGAVGGAGGNGTYSSSEYRKSFCSDYSETGCYGPFFYWDSVYRGRGTSCWSASGSVTSGGATYSLAGGGTTPAANPCGSSWGYGITRTASATSTGGAGGSFGVGAGYNQSATNGGSGASGSNNAGSGGAGSNGAALGTAAATSSAGSNGNASNGAAGNAGGAAGAAVTGTSVTMNNSGTVHGAVA